MIANREIDVWEVGYVWAWIEPDSRRLGRLEARLFHDFDAQSPLMNGSLPLEPGVLDFAVPDKIVVQVMDSDEIAVRREPSLRLPRQAEHYQRLVDHILNVKDALGIASCASRALRADAGVPQSLLRGVISWPTTSPPRSAIARWRLCDPSRQSLSKL